MSSDIHHAPVEKQALVAQLSQMLSSGRFLH